MVKIKWITSDSIEDLIKKAEKEIKADLIISLKKSAKSLNKLMYQKVQDWYASRSPSTYTERTYQVLSALTIGEVEEKEGFLQIEVYFDGDKLSEEFLEGNNGWFSHKNSQGQRWVGGEFNFWEMMENGWHLPKSSGTDFEGHGAVAMGIDWAEMGKFCSDIQNWLNKQGYEIVKK